MLQDRLTHIFTDYRNRYLAEIFALRRVCFFQSPNEASEEFENDQSVVADRTLLAADRTCRNIFHLLPKVTFKLLAGYR